MKISARPGSLSHIELELLKCAIQCFAFPPLASGSRIFGGQLLQIRSHQPCQSSLPLNGNFANLFNEIIIKREGDVHTPIIRKAQVPLVRRH